MATGTKSKTATVEVTGPAVATSNGTGGKGQPRPRAVVETIDFSDAADDSELVSAAGPRASKWMQILNDLYDGTEGGKVPRNEDGSLKFVRLGTFSNVGGARTQVKSFEDKGLDTTYEFKTQVKANESFLWARVRETADAVTGEG